MFDVIINAQTRQKMPYSSSNIYNAFLSSAVIKKQLKLSPATRKLILSAAQRLALSACSYFKMIKVAQIITDLESWLQDSVQCHVSNRSSETIQAAHITEALQYRLAPL